MHALLQLKVMKRDSYDGRAHKSFSDNRELSFLMSKHRCTYQEARAMRAAEYAATAAPDQLYDADISDGFALKYL